jgi:hypothetical protein
MKCGIFRDQDQIKLFAYVEQTSGGRWIWGIADENKHIGTVSVHTWEHVNDAKMNLSYWLEGMGLSLRGGWR